MSREPVTPSEPLAFDHVAQVVPDVRAAVAWACRTLPGCRVLHEDDTWGFVAAPGVKLAFVKEGLHPDHVGFRVPAGELERLAELHRKSIRMHRDKTRGFYLEAPGGRWIEFITYPEDSEYGGRAE